MGQDSAAVGRPDRIIPFPRWPDPEQRTLCGSVSSCTFSVDGSVLVSGAYDRTVAVWNMETLCKTLELKGHADWVTDVAISADKKWVASASKDTTVRLWNIEHSEDIPAVIETRKAQGYHILQCEECGKAFSISRLENSDLVTKCVFCRLKTETRSHLQPPPLLSSVLPIEDGNQIPSSTSSSVVFNGNQIPSSTSPLLSSI
uniref:WD repeat-containing protein 88-like n=1 Tax=Oncorhynchus gorbuscha TaxID=8017 RepID=UPI001EAEBE01|nr:WD repeat-containing protein 88-like [Oncorhynchus gorbuscha]